MTISDAFLKIQIGANLKPDSVLTGSIAAGFTSESKPASGARKHVMTARVIFSANGQTAAFYAPNGNQTSSTTGERQEETATVTSAAGATANGNLPVTLTSSRVTGSPLAISVPLNTYNHGTAALIAAAIADKLNATPAVAIYFTATAQDATVVLKSKYGFATDATLNLAITAGLGVTAAPTSATTVPGTAGVIIERPGGHEKDAFGQPWGVSASSFLEAAIRCTEGVGGWVTHDPLGAILPGDSRAAICNDTGFDMLFQAVSGPSIVEFTAFAY